MSNRTSDNLIKIRAYCLISLAVLLYPLLIFMVVLDKIFHWISGNRSCKNVIGEVAVVTGAAGGLGRCLSLELAKRSCHVAIVDVNFEGAQETAKLITQKYHVKAKAYQVDVSKYEEMAQLNEQVSKDFGPATVLINNAAILELPENADWRAIQNMIDVNLAAHIWANRVFMPKMKELKKGYVVAVASIASFLAMANHDVYVSTKFAVRGFMRSLTLQLKAENLPNIHTTTVFPKLLDTNEQILRTVQQLKRIEMWPVIRGEDAAREIIDGMLENKNEMLMPGLLAILSRLFENLPADWRASALMKYGRNRTAQKEMALSSKKE